MPRVEGQPIHLPQKEIPVLPEVSIFLPDGGTPERILKKDLRLPALLIIKETEFHERVENLPRLARTEVKYDEYGNIYYPTWRERTRVLKPEIYESRSKLRRGWSLEKTLRLAPRKPISEKVYHQVKKDEGSVEVAIRNMDHILAGYQVEGEEVEEIKILQGQINQALDVLFEYPSQINPEEFEEGFEDLHQETVRILEDLGMNNVILEVKKQLADLVDRGTRGKDWLERRNPRAMLLILEAGLKRVERRRRTMRFIRDKFEPMKGALIRERDESREILQEIQKEMGREGLAGHVLFSHPERGDTPLQRGVIRTRLDTTIRRLSQIKLKPYRPVAKELIDRLKRAQALVGEGKYRKANEIFVKARAETEAVLGDDRYRQIYPEKNEK